MERRKKKFHDALLKLYHPSPSTIPQSHNSQSSPAAEEEEEEHVKVSHFDIQSDTDPAESEELEKEGCDFGSSEKLTRAQRKRIRRRKLKEASLTRRKIIGPLLLPSGYENHKEEEAFQGQK